jgi:predicted CopG family antitoxin
MDYQEARRVRNTGLFNLAAQNIASGGGIGSSLGSAISSKFKAKITGIKEKFDPLNIAKKITGNFGAAVLGKLTGRSQKDIQYFAGGKRYGSSAGVTQESNLDAIQPALYTNVKEGQRQRMKKGDSVSDVLARLYNLTKKNYESEENRREKEIRDKYKENERNQKWHKELLDAILGPNSLKKEKDKKTKKKGFSIFDLIDKLQNKFNSFIEGLENKIKEGAERAIEKKVAKSALVAATETAAETAGKEVGKDVSKSVVETTEKTVVGELAEDVTKKAAETTGKTAATTATEAAGKTAATTATEAAGKTAIKEVSESAIKETAKKSVEKLVVEAGSESIPLIGGLIGAAFAVPRMLKGDYFGAGLEVASGVGGIGTSVAGGVLLAARDVYNEVYKNPETGVPANLENDLVTDYDGTKERLTKITNVIDTLITESLKQRKEDTAKAAEMNKPVVTENAGGAAFIHRGSGLKRGTGQATKIDATEPISTVNESSSSPDTATKIPTGRGGMKSPVEQPVESLGVSPTGEPLVRNQKGQIGYYVREGRTSKFILYNNMNNTNSTSNNTNTNQSNSNMVNNSNNQSNSSMVNNSNQSNSSMVNNQSSSNMPSATMTPPVPNPLTERAVSSINENNNLQIEKSQPKIVTIDKSKNINVASKDNSPSLVLDSSVNVRSDDPTLQRTQKQNLRPV